MNSGNNCLDFGIRIVSGWVNLLMRFSWFTGLCTVLFFCVTAFSQNAYPHFHDVARQSGLTVPHISGEKRYILESRSGGVGLFDCDNDGKLDIVVVNGSTVDRFRKGGARWLRFIIRMRIFTSPTLPSRRA